MAKGLTAVATGAAILIGMAASAAHAAEAPKAKPAQSQASFTGREAFAPDQNQWGPQRNQRSLQFDQKKGRWGLKLDMQQTNLRDQGVTESEAGAGAYYRVTPSLRVGGGVAVNQRTDERAGVTQDRAPRVKLETAFKF